MPSHWQAAQCRTRPDCTDGSWPTPAKAASAIVARSSKRNIAIELALRAALPSVHTPAVPSVPRTIYVYICEDMGIPHRLGEGSGALLREYSACGLSPLQDSSAPWLLHRAHLLHLREHAAGVAEVAAIQALADGAQVGRVRDHVVVELRVLRDRLREGPRVVRRQQRVQRTECVLPPTCKRQCLASSAD